MAMAHGANESRKRVASRHRVVLEDDLQRMHNEFADVRVRHPMMERLLDELMPLLTQDSESHIIVIVGAPGVGKTTLFKRVIATLFEQFASVTDQDRTVIPLVTVEARAEGDGRPGFQSLYEELLLALHEPRPDRKACIEVHNGRMVNRATGMGRIKALRNAVDQALKERRTRVCVIDEATHLLRFAKQAAVLDTFKSLSNTTGVKWIVLGSYDLFDLVDNGQLARRSEVLCLERYHRDDVEDRQAFRDVVRKIQAKWPCEQVPNFASISNELLDVSFGCVGLLKTIMLDACAMQLHNGGDWDSGFLRKATKSIKLLDTIRRDIEAGEAKVRDALRGDCIWDATTLAELTRRLAEKDG